MRISPHRGACFSCCLPTHLPRPWYTYSILQQARRLFFLASRFLSRPIEQPSSITPAPKHKCAPPPSQRFQQQQPPLTLRAFHGLHCMHNIADATYCFRVTLATPPSSNLLIVDHFRTDFSSTKNRPSCPHSDALNNIPGEGVGKFEVCGSSLWGSSTSSGPVLLLWILCIHCPATNIICARSSALL